jgi:hypothetical protein
MKLKNRRSVVPAALVENESGLLAAAQVCCDGRLTKLQLTARPGASGESGRTPNLRLRLGVPALAAGGPALRSAQGAFVRAGADSP